MKEVVGRSEDLAKGHMFGAQVGPFPVVVIRAPDGSLHGLLDKCLHQGGPLSQGRLAAASTESADVGDYRFERSGEILRCPWHGYEYDIRSGCTIPDPSQCLRTFAVTEEDGNIVVER